MVKDGQSACYVGRFAPSPTGDLHFGSLVAAVGSFVDARAHNGTWGLRIEDVDRTRAVRGAADAIRRSLVRFGLHWDGPVVTQSERGEAYAGALDRLVTAGLAFPCGCTRREVREAGIRGPAGFLYPGTCRAGLPPGRRARAWRFRVDSREAVFDDRLRGRQRATLADTVGDFIVRRADGLFAYHLAMVVDDAELRVTDVVRGGDLLDATPSQVALQAALGYPQPRYLHLPVALDTRGRKLSKQTRAPSVADLEPAPALHDALAFLGHPPPAALRRATVADCLGWAIAHWDVARMSSKNRTPPESE